MFLRQKTEGGVLLNTSENYAVFLNDTPKILHKLKGDNDFYQEWYISLGLEDKDRFIEIDEWCL